jgi:glycerol-3-phosphate dehydrogenase
MNDFSHDVIVIGGGINGVGIARDCALRGMKTLLIEKHDFAKGASGNNTGMIHGGIRYLRYDVGTTKSSCTDSGYIQKIAEHLLHRVAFLFPIMKSDFGGQFLLEGAEIFFEAYDRFQPLKNGKSHTRLTREEALELEPGLSPNIIGAVTLDEWAIDSYRLTVENAVDAKLAGAQIRNYC